MDHALVEAGGPERRERINHVSGGLGSRYKLEQLHDPHGVEEMGDRNVSLKPVGHSGCNVTQGNP